MKQPKFQVGDVVQVKFWLTGHIRYEKATVLGCKYRECTKARCATTGQLFSVYDTYFYFLDCHQGDINELVIHPYPQQKHEPSEFDTWEKLRDSLGLGVVA